MNNGIEVFLKTNHDEAVTYIMAGIVEDEQETTMFTGMIYAHSGGGDFDKEFVYKNRLMPLEKSFTETGSFWDATENAKNVAFLSDYPKLGNEIEFELKSLSFDEVSQAFYIPKLLKYSLDDFNTISTERFLKNEIVPFDFGNTIFYNPIKRWTFEEINDMCNKKIIEDLQFEKNFNSCLECQKGIENKEVKAINTVAEYVTVYPETSPRKLINAVNDNLGVEFDTYDIEVIATIETLVMDGELNHTIPNNDFSLDYYYKTMNDYLDEDTLKDTEKGKKVNKDR